MCRTPRRRRASRPADLHIASAWVVMPERETRPVRGKQQCEVNGGCHAQADRVQPDLAQRHRVPAPSTGRALGRTKNQAETRTTRECASSVPLVGVGGYTVKPAVIADFFARLSRRSAMSVLGACVSRATSE